MVAESSRFILRAQRLADEGNLCSFGLVSAPLAAFLASDVGLGAGLAGGIATGLTGAAVGAAGGAGLGAITGEGAGKGALFGGITGGVAGGLGPALGAAGEAAGIPADIATTGGDVLAGVGGGLAGSAISGQPLLTGALEGGVGGLASGALTAGAAPTATPAPAANAVPPGGVSGAGASPASAALPGGGIPVSGDLLGPGTTAPAAGGGAFGSYGLTDVGAPQNIGPGTIGGGDAGGAPAGSFSPPAAVDPDPGATLPGDANFSGGTGTGTGLDSIVSKLTSNPSLLLGAGALGLDALKQNQPLPEQTQLNKIGAQAEATGNQLSSYVSSGTLPPGAQESINLATTAAKSQVRSTAAQLGLSGSTWEADRMAQIDQQASAQGEQFAQQLLQQGANYTQLSTGVFENLMKSTLQQDQAFQQALAQFAGGLAGAKTGAG